MTTYRTDPKVPKLVSVSIFPANKGLHSSVPSALVQHEELNQSRNLIHTTSGSRRTRPGIEPYYLSGIGDGGPVRGLLDHWASPVSTKTQRVIAGVQNSTDESILSVYADNADGVFERILVSNGTITTSPEGFVPTGFMSFDAMVDLAIIGFQGLNRIATYNQTGSLQFITTTPAAGWIVRKHRNAIYLAGDVNNPDVLYKSEDEDPTSWFGGTSDIFNIDLGASDPVGITALSPTLYGRMYVGKFNSIYELQTFAGGQSINPLVEGIGMISHNAVVATQNDIIFPSTRGLHSLATTQNYGDVSSTFITFPINDIWNETIDFTQAQKMSAAFVPEYNSYLITVPKRFSTDFDLIGYNIATGDLFHWENFNASFLSTVKDSQKRTRLLVGTNDANIGLGRTINDNTFEDFLESFASGFKTGNIFPTGQPGTQWSFKHLTVFYRPVSTRNIQVIYTIDNKETGTLQFDQSGASGVLLKNFVLGVDILGATSTGYQQQTKELVGYGNSIQLDFNTEDGAMEIFGYEVQCEQVGDATIPVSAGT